MTQQTDSWDPDPDDEGQLSAEDTLSDRGLDDSLDEGYSPPEKPRGVTAFGVTQAEAEQGESLDLRLRQEEPDTLDQLDDDDYGRTTESGEFFDEGEVGDRRAGRLVAPDEGYGEDDEKDEVGSDVGIDGGAASAEEAAMHIVNDRDL
ncbi:MULTISPECIES: DUF5709 domain-containing protein [Dactylosporangium]|uniref:DUF5709 domain-containing protein n=2 Tax=Dactylosporangium TaxID=35753 RepID=A0A9W6KLR7_9ACTN|nr:MULTISPECIES: DUF5709 domain-containing protein [Dactylosporangium]UAB94935.1 hypothetical protein Dvina_43820 [Dactylosporangium vinaceum]UWZ43304.1 hypothetical protein Dmats_38420 [Dactylosporangium matsuzakiense]GLL02586.1 hypothetical protein GCM10017581_043280 [Dactylosporangium matsuzakiense]